MDDNRHMNRTTRSDGSRGSSTGRPVTPFGPRNGQSSGNVGPVRPTNPGSTGQRSAGSLPRRPEEGTGRIPVRSAGANGDSSGIRTQRSVAPRRQAANDTGAGGRQTRENPGRGVVRRPVAGQGRRQAQGRSNNNNQDRTKRRSGGRLSGVHGGVSTIQEMPKQKLLYLMQIGLFVLILAIGSGSLFFGALQGKTYSDLEKRNLKKFPKVKVKNVLNGKFESRFSDALADHIIGRDLYVTFKTNMEIMLGKKEINGIYMDKDQLIETYKDSDFDDKQTKENVDALTGFLSKIAKGIGTDKVHVMTIPSKATIYRDHLPGYIPKSTKPDELVPSIRQALKEKLMTQEETAEDTDEDDTDTTEDVWEDESDTATTEDGWEDEGDTATTDDGWEDEGDSTASDGGDSSGESDSSAAMTEDDGDYDATDDALLDEGEMTEEEADALADSGKSGWEDEGDLKLDADGWEIEDETEQGGSSGGSSDNGSGGGSNLISGGKTDFTEEEATQAVDQMVIDLRDVLTKHSNEYIYYKTDHHWTTLGAFYAYHEWKGPDRIIPAYKTAVSTDFLGTDYNRIHYYESMDKIYRYEMDDVDQATVTINDGGDTKELPSIYVEDALKTSDQYNYFLSGNYSTVTIKTKNKNGKTLLVVKDSFTNSMIPFLCRDYETIRMVDLRYVNASVYEYMNDLTSLDDVIVIYNEEKFMQDAHQYYLK